MSFAAWISALIRRRRLEHDMSKEMRHNLELETDARMRAGASPGEARRQALVAFGGVDQMKERVRDERSTRWLEVAFTETLGAVGRLRRHPGFALGAAFSLALGMSVATAVFSMVDTLFLRTLSLPAPDRLVHIYRIGSGAVLQYSTITARQFVSAATEAKSFTGVAAARFGTRDAIIGDNGDATSYPTLDVTPNYFDVLGLRPALGRLFTDDDAHLGRARPVVIGYSLWQSRFAGNPSIVGRSIRINGAQRMIIGVLPRTADLPWPASVWLPYSPDTIRAHALTGDEEAWGGYAAIGRLAPGATRERAGTELDMLFNRIEPPSTNVRDRFHASAMSLAAHISRPYRESASLWIAAAIVITILCAVNFATMSLARGMRRRGEIAVRTALGAAPARVIALLASEGALIALGGGLLAVVFAYGLLGSSHLWLGDATPLAPTIGWRAAAFGIVATTVVGALCALAPAIDLAKTDLRSLIAGDSGAITVGRRELRGRRGLVALQIALALSSVAIVASLVQADRRLQSDGPGYDYSSMVTANVVAVDPAARPGLADRVRDAFQSSGDVAASTVVRTHGVAGVLSDQASVEAGLQWIEVDPDYFTTLDLHPISGRLPTPEEAASRAPVMVLSKFMVRMASLGNVDPIGHRVRLRVPGTPGVWYTVIGVVPDIRFGPRFEYWFPPAYTVSSSLPPVELIAMARMRGDPAARLRPLSAKLHSLDSRLVISDLQTVTQQVGDWHSATRTRTVFLSVVSALALLLAIVGVFGLTSFTTELRIREFGVRVALGAPRARLVGVIAGELWWMGCIGVAAGYFMSTRAALLLDAQFQNPLLRMQVVTFQLVPTLISAVALLLITALGTYVPLRRVLRMDVMRALQSS
ncbi:MAG: ABC transporter permease [Gemmatimonadaceae bacterium]